MKATLCEQTYALGRNRYKVNSAGQWQCLMFGWYPDVKDHTPRYRWEWIKRSRVPDEVLEQAGM